MWLSAAIVLVASFHGAVPDHYDDLITKMELGGDYDAYKELFEGDETVDLKLLAKLKQFEKSDDPLDAEKARNIIFLLGDRHFPVNSGGTQPKSVHEWKDLSDVVTVLRLMPKIRDMGSSTFFERRGPAFYRLLVKIANDEHEAPIQRKIARGFLRTTAMSARFKPRGDPALIRIFRKANDLEVLGFLRDKGSIPKMRAAVNGTDRKLSVIAMGALGAIPDPNSVSLLVPHLADPEEVAAGKATGKFGPAYWALRCMVGPKDAPLLLKFAESHNGYARASALNLLGYVGPATMIPDIEQYTKDPPKRVRDATVNAIRRMRGELTKNTDWWMKR